MGVPVTDLDAGQLLQCMEQGLSAREVAAEVVTSFGSRVASLDPKVHAFLHFDLDDALAQAAKVDEKRAKKLPLGRLAGIPVAIKDNLCTVGQTATCGSRMLENFRPPFDAHVVARLRQEDAILFGRVNMDEFAMGSSTENSAFGVTRNPWSLDCIPGGSSGGSAACVAAGFAPLALGSDTGGSIRQPAGLCGVNGMKPTYGLVSRYGLVAFASSLDQIGPFARNARDLALLLGVIAGHDPRDSTSVDRPVPDFAAELNKPIREGLRLGIVPEHFEAGLDAEVAACVREAIRQFKERGAQIVETPMPHARYAIATYYLVATAEASSNLARYDGVHYGVRAKNFGDMVDMYMATRGEHFGAEVKRRIMLGTFALSAGYRDAYYIKALQVRRLIKRDFDEAFEKVDAIVGPVAPTPAFKLGDKVDDPLAMYLSDIYTVSANLAGICGLSIPCGLSKAGLPIGLQIQAPAFGEETALGVASWFQSFTDWHSRRAPL